LKSNGSVGQNAQWVLTNNGINATYSKNGYPIPSRSAWHTKIGIVAFGNGITAAQAFEKVLDTFDVQLEVGATKTDYVPFSFYEEYTADENGEVDIPSRSPYMMIAPKANGQTIHAVCNRDLTMVINNIEQSIKTLVEG
jgi:hypothetical protein